MNTAIDPRFAPIVDRVRSDEQTKREARKAKLEEERRDREAQRAADREARATKALDDFEEGFIIAVTEQQTSRKWSADTFMAAVEYASALIRTSPETEIPEVTSQVAEVIHRVFAFTIVQTRNFQAVDHYVGQRESWYPEWQQNAVAWLRKKGQAKKGQPKAELKYSTSTDSQSDDESQEPTETVDDGHLTSNLGELVPELKAAITRPAKKRQPRNTGHSASGKRTAKKAASKKPAKKSVNA